MSYAPFTAYSRLLRGTHEPAAAGEAWSQPRRVITTSWRRSIRAGIDPNLESAPLTHDMSHVNDARDSHPLRPLLPLLAQTLSGLTDHVVLVTDRDGTVLWRDGSRDVARRADDVGLADGHQWAETSVGTNGIGTALATRRPVHVYSDEHLMRVLHVWSCSAAPITDPDSGELLGCVDVSDTAASLHPATLALVAAAAKLAEAQLALRMHERDERLRRRFESLRGRPGILLSPTGRVIAGDPAGTLGDRVPVPGAGRRTVLRDGRVAQLEPFSEGYLLRAAPAAPPASLRLSFLGEGPPRIRHGDHERPLSLRHAEILALLALHPRGLTAEQLSFHLYGDTGNPVTIRAEIHRLRTWFGDAVAAKPYRLACPVEADFLALRALLSSGEPAALARAYTGPLLPRSESPEIRRERDELEVQVRSCLLRKGSPDDLWAYAQTPNGRDDYEVLERLATLPGPRSAAAQTRLH